MISVEHYQELADVSWSVRDAIVNETPEYMASYFSGLRRPRYPMPSLITEKSMWRNCIMLFKGEETEPFKMWFKN